MRFVTRSITLTVYCRDGLDDDQMTLSTRASPEPTEMRACGMLQLK